MKSNHRGLYRKTVADDTPNMPIHIFPDEWRPGVSRWLEADIQPDCSTCYTSSLNIFFLPLQRCWTQHYFCDGGRAMWVVSANRHLHQFEYAVKYSTEWQKKEQESFFVSNRRCNSIVKRTSLGWAAIGTLSRVKINAKPFTDSPHAFSATHSDQTPDFPVSDRSRKPPKRALSNLFKISRYIYVHSSF